MARGVPRHGPHRGFVPTLDLRRRVLGAAAHDPVHDGTIVPAAGQQRLVLRVPDHGGDVPRVPPEVLNLVHRANVEHLDRLVLAPGRQPVAVGVPLQARNLVLVRVYIRALLSLSRVPQNRQRVLPARGEQAFVRVPVHALDVAAVAAHGVHRRGAGEIEDSHRRVVGARTKF